MKADKFLIVVVGPTAVGKTSLAIELAKKFHAEIVSADSRQIYREMEVGTAKPTDEELNQAPHHLINTHSIERVYDAGQFTRDTDEILKALFTKNDVAVMVGGSGLYVKAFCEGLDEMPEVPNEIRELLNKQFEEEGLEPLLSELMKADPVYYDQVDRMNPQRVIRGVEIIRATGKPYSDYRKNQPTRKHDFEIVKIGLEMDRSILYDRIDHRMDQMIEMGLFEEAQRLHPYQNNNALQTVGYQEIFGYLNGEYDKEEAIRLLKRNSRRYAKRQMTWFKRDEDVHWFNPNIYSAIESFLETKFDSIK